MVTGLWYTHDLNFGSLSWFRRCKEHPCPLSPHLGLWRTLEVPDWGLASWSWFGYGHLSLTHPRSEFWFSILNLKVQRTASPLIPNLGLWRMLEVPNWVLASWSWFGYGHLSLKGVLRFTNDLFGKQRHWSFRIRDKGHVANIKHKKDIYIRSAKIYKIWRVNRFD